MDETKTTSAYEDDFLSATQNFEHKQMLEKADNIVLGFVATTGATGAIPIPFADAPLLIAQQVAMMAAINGAFKINVKEDVLKSLVLTALGVGGATVVGKTIATNLIKLFPGAGSVVGGTISAATAGALTLALGKAYIQVCKAIKMGKLDQNALTKKEGRDALKKAFKEQLANRKADTVEKAEETLLSDDISANENMQNDNVVYQGKTSNQSTGTARKKRVGKYYGVTPTDTIKFAWMDAKFALRKKPKKKQ